MLDERLPTVRPDDDSAEALLHASSGYSYLSVSVAPGQAPHVRDMALLVKECWWVGYQRINVEQEGGPTRVANIIRLVGIRPRHAPTVGPSAAEVLRRLNAFAEALFAQRSGSEYDYFVIDEAPLELIRYLLTPADLEPYLQSPSPQLQYWAEATHAQLSVPNGPLWDRLKPLFDSAVTQLDVEDARCPLDDELQNDRAWLGYGNWKEMYRYAVGAKQQAWVERLRRIDFTGDYAAQLREAYSWEDIAGIMGSAAVINDDDEGGKDPAWTPWIQQFIGDVVSVLTPEELPHLLAFQGRGAEDLRSWVITSLEKVEAKPKRKARARRP